MKSTDSRVPLVVRRASWTMSVVPASKSAAPASWTPDRAHTVGAAAPMAKGTRSEGTGMCTCAPSYHVLRQECWDAQTPRLDSHGHSDGLVFDSRAVDLPQVIELVLSLLH